MCGTGWYSIASYTPGAEVNEKHTAPSLDMCQNQVANVIDDFLKSLPLANKLLAKIISLFQPAHKNNSFCLLLRTRKSHWITLKWCRMTRWEHLLPRTNAQRDFYNKTEVGVDVIAILKLLPKDGQSQCFITRWTCLQSTRVSRTGAAWRQIQARVYSGALQAELRSERKHQMCHWRGRLCLKRRTEYVTLTGPRVQCSVNTVKIFKYVPQI